jgi:hypothetical protein
VNAPASLLRHSVDGLGPIRDALAGVRARHGDGPTHGVTPTIVVPRLEIPRWHPAAEVTGSAGIDALLHAASVRWPGGPHVAAALAFKSYAYWVTLPAVIGFAAARRVPRVDAANTLARIHGVAPFVEIGLARPELTALTTDPVPGAHLVRDDAALLAVLREQLLDRHLAPLADELHTRTRLGRRTLLGSLASAVCYALLRAGDVLPGPAAPTATKILEALEIADLISLTPDDSGKLQIKRRTCCLEFAAETPRVCAGCVLS